MSLRAASHVSGDSAKLTVTVRRLAVPSCAVSGLGRSARIWGMAVSDSGAIRLLPFRIICRKVKNQIG
jgi:hypothetical protein